MQIKSSTTSPFWSVQDLWATAYATPSVASMQLTNLLYANSSSSRSQFILSAPISPIGSQHYSIEVGLPSYLIWAFGSGAFAYHGTMNRGTAIVTFFPAANIPTSDPSPFTMALLMPNITVPSSAVDMYVCNDFTLPGTQQQPFHITSYDTIIDTINLKNQPKYVHHMVLYNCSAPPPTLNTGPYQCIPDNSNMAICNKLIITLAGQVQTDYYPTEAGIRIGDNAMKYVSPWNAALSC